jgi:hypothetical protein
MILAVSCTLVGLVFLFGLRGIAQGSDAGAVFWVGVLLVGIGAASALTGGRQTVVVDPRKSLILVEDATVFGTKKHVIPFGEVETVGIGYLGKRSNGVMMYYLVLHLKGGREYSLFSPGRFYVGASDSSIVEGWRQRLQNYLEQA